jgi:hypothetical protein
MRTGSLGFAARHGANRGHAEPVNSDLDVMTDVKPLPPSTIIPARVPEEPLPNAATHRRGVLLTPVPDCRILWRDDYCPI